MPQVNMGLTLGENEMNTYNSFRKIWSLYNLNGLRSVSWRPE